MRQYHPSSAMLLLALACTMPASAEVYRSVDKQGNVTYTNQAADGAEPVQLKPLSVYDAPDLKSADENIAGDSSDASIYKSIAITSPQADETLRDNSGNVTVTASSEPALDSKAGDRYLFFLDGKAYGKPQVAATKALVEVDRGEHQVGVAVVDASGKQLMRSKPTRFFLHRQTIFNPARKPPSPSP